jgi:hypothetical protein
VFFFSVWGFKRTLSNFWSLAACGFGDELLGAETNPAILSEIISNALPQPMLKDGKLNELSVSSLRFFT